MRWNTGSSYPAVEEDVMLRLLIPSVKKELRDQIGSMSKRKSQALLAANDLVAQSKSDVESLIEGTLDTHAILAGRLKPPTMEELVKT